MSYSYPFENGAPPRNHSIYVDYIGKLGLQPADLSHLTKRGLSSEHIHKAQYATKPVNNSSVAQEALGHISKKYKPDGVPGFFINEKGSPSQSGSTGIIIPCRDVNGHISSLLIRNTPYKTGKSTKFGNKYIYFSSNGKEKGGKVWSTTHCPIVRGPARKVSGTTVRITEGFLKADVASALDPEMYCLGMNGLNPPSDLDYVLEELEIDTLIIALDAGEHENKDMIRGIIKLVTLAKKVGVDFEIELWNPEDGKGIDDVLAAGNKDKIRYATDDEIKKILLDEDATKPIIIVSGGGLSDQATQGEKALISAGFKIYQRGNKLITPVMQQTEASGGRQTTIAVMHETSRSRMRDDLCKAADWAKIGEKDGLDYINPPYSVAETILSRYGQWAFPPLAGVLMTPTLRPDGSILKDTGYDSSTRLYLLHCPPMPEIPEAPSHKDALAALKILEGLLIDFPFVDSASRSVALSALITPVVRGAFPVVPMHVIRAPSAGSGKSYLLDTASAIAIGQRCPIIVAGRTEEETEKRLGAALLTGQSLISIDNFNGDLGGDALCQFVERPLASVRILGKSEQVTIESRATFFANGNNIRILGDMTRRVVQCTLDAKCERPEQRTFKINPFETVLSDRGKYIAAALTIIRAYIVAGKPGIIFPRLASFEEWSDLVRSALVWLGRTDPLIGMEAARAEDPRLQEVTEVFTAIWDVMGDKRFTARELVDLAQKKTCEIECDVPVYPALWEALVNAAGDRGRFLTPKRVGQWLSRHKSRICNNLRLENEADKHGHPAKWWLVESGSAVQSG